MWFDSWEDPQKYSQHVPTPATYVRTHTVAQAALREVSGLAAGVGDYFMLTFLACFLALPCSGIAYFRQESEERRQARRLAVSIVVCFYLSSAWFAPIAHPVRYVAPIFPIMAYHLAGLICFYKRRLVRSPDRRRKVGAAVTVALAAALTAGAVSAIVALPRGSPLTMNALDPSLPRLIAFLERPEFDGKRLVMLPTRALAGTWIYNPHVTFLEVPTNIPPGGFVRWLEQVRADYLMLSPDLVRRRSTRLAPIASPCGETRFRMKRLPRGWRVLLEKPGRWAVLALPARGDRVDVR
jgi:hypothetical protein